MQTYKDLTSYTLMSHIGSRRHIEHSTYYFITLSILWYGRIIGIGPLPLSGTRNPIGRNHICSPCSSRHFHTIFLNRQNNTPLNILPYSQTLSSIVGEALMVSSS